MIAITRDVSPSVAACELTHLERTPIDYERACRQHDEYRRALAAAGFEIVALPADAALPDCVFVEDTAVVLDEVAVITRPGAASRRPEVGAVAAALARHRPLVAMEAPATLDGGDVLVLDRTIFVGSTERTSEAGIDSLRALTAPYGYEVVAVPVDGCLHLKTAVTQVSREALLVNPEWVNPSAFADWEIVTVDPAEPFGANALLAGTRVLYPAAWTRTRTLLEARGIEVVPVPADELAKAEGGVTCCSLLIRS